MVVIASTRELVADGPGGPQALPLYTARWAATQMVSWGFRLRKRRRTACRLLAAVAGDEPRDVERHLVRHQQSERVVRDAPLAVAALEHACAPAR